MRFSGSQAERGLWRYAPDGNTGEPPSVLTRDQLFQEGARLDVMAYAETRVATESWITVEIGPGSRPSGLNRSFKGSDSLYLGIERDINTDFSQNCESKFARLRTVRSDENIIICPGIPEGKLVAEADEVFITYVLDDLHTRKPIVIDEAWEVLKPGGIAIIYDKDIKALSIARALKKKGFDIPYVASIKRGIDQRLLTQQAIALGIYEARPGNRHNPLQEEPDLLMLAQKPFSSK